jgi:hypothetical protein
MRRVSVVFTEHAESGLANASGLLAILERIRPEVIFLECPPAAFDNYLNGTRATPGLTGPVPGAAVREARVPVDHYRVHAFE